jgi:transcriptional regulator with XRE-family HTH domain
MTYQGDDIYSHMRALRRAYGLRQRQLAKILNTDHAVISKWERKQGTGTFKYLVGKRIAQYFGYELLIRTVHGNAEIILNDTVA